MSIDIYLSIHGKVPTSHTFDRYLLMQVPSNLFLNKIGKPALYLPTTVRLNP